MITGITGLPSLRPLSEFQVIAYDSNLNAVSNMQSITGQMTTTNSLTDVEFYIMNDMDSAGLTDVRIYIDYRYANDMPEDSGLMIRMDKEFTWDIGIYSRNCIAGCGAWSGLSYDDSSSTDYNYIYI